MYHCQRQLGIAVNSGGSRKKYLGGLALIMWEATTAKRNYVLHRPTNVLEVNVLFYTDVGMRIKVSAQSQKVWGWARFGGPVPPGPNIEAPLAVKQMHQGRWCGLVEIKA